MAATGRGQINESVEGALLESATLPRVTAPKPAYVVRLVEGFTMARSDEFKSIITIDVDGAPRRVLRITETLKGDRVGDVIMSPPFGRYSRGKFKRKDGTEFEGDAEVANTHFSLHPSINDATYNAFNETVRLKDNSILPVCGRFSTRSIKDGSMLFTSLFTQVCGDLRDVKYDVGAKVYDNQVSLGSLDPTFDSLVFGLFVGHRDSVFENPRPAASAHVEVVTALFKIVMIARKCDTPSIRPFRITSRTEPEPGSQPELAQPSGHDQLIEMLKGGLTPQMAISHHDYYSKVIGDILFPETFPFSWPRLINCIAPARDWGPTERAFRDS